MIRGRRLTRCLRSKTQERFSLWRVRCHLSHCHKRAQSIRATTTMRQVAPVSSKLLSASDWRSGTGVVDAASRDSLAPSKPPRLPNGVLSFSSSLQ